MSALLSNSTAARNPKDGVPAAGGSPRSTNAPSELARSITGRPYLSWTQVTQYQLCPRAFAFKYVEKEEPAFVPSSLLFGSAMHEAFAKVHEHQMEGLAAPTGEQLAAKVTNLLDASLLPIKFSKTESADTLTALARRMVDAFLASPESAPLGTAVCIEDRIAGNIDPQIPPIEGKVDYVRKIGESLILRDYKTSKTKWSPDKVEEHAPQLRLYASLLDKELTGWRVREMEFVTVTKAVKPVVQVHQVRIKPESVQACTDQIGEVWHGIREGVFPTRPGWPCKSCPYASKCPAAIGETGVGCG
jgi:putative RecB family exonuclease